MTPTEIIAANGVHGWLHRGSAADGLVLAHGAGSDAQAPLLIAFAQAFTDLGLTVLRCDLPFRQAHPHGPPPRAFAPADREGLRNALIELRQHASGRIFLGGHSYGGRQASMLAAECPDVTAGLLLLSYPLHPPRRFSDLRTAHFPALRTPALFVHGTRDPFGSIAELQAALPLIPAPTELLPIERAGHDLFAGRNAREAATAFLRFIDGR